MIRKAAILIDTLDQAAADALLDQMPEAHAQRVRQAVVHLSGVSPEERALVVEEFMNRKRPAAQVSQSSTFSKTNPNLHASHHSSIDQDGGIELDDSLAEKLRQPPAMSTAKAETSPSSGERPPFRFLHEAETDTLTSFLRHEHPQTVAVVASHLPADRAAEFIARLAPPALQAEVVRRIVELDEADPAIIREVEAELETLLSERLRATKRRNAGLSAVRAILAAADLEDRKDLLANLAQRDRDLATRLSDANVETTAVASREIPVGDADRSTANHVVTSEQQSSAHPKASQAATTKPISKRRNELSRTQSPPTRRSPVPSLQFEELTQLDNGALSYVFHAASPQLSLLALTGAPRQLVDRILRQLPPREAKQLTAKLENSGPIRLRDVEIAQQHLARLAGQLAAEGKIKLPKVQRFAAAA